MTFEEITKDILIKAIENGYIPKVNLPNEEELTLEENLKFITTAYKEIYFTVLDPIDPIDED